MIVLIIIADPLAAWCRSCRCFSAVDDRSRCRPEALPPLRLAGRDIYVREGCYLCHSQMIRPFRAETERYGHYSVAGEFVYDRPFQWGSKRTGPDLARVGKRYSDEWHRVHLINPRDVVPESIMPGYPWLAETPADASAYQRRWKSCVCWVHRTAMKTLPTRQRNWKARPRWMP